MKGHSPSRGAGLAASRFECHDGIAQLIVISMEGKPMKIVVLGIDLAKNVFALHGVDEHGKPALVQPSVRREKLLEVVAQLPPCLISMEACSSAHHWARAFSRFGHTVRLMAPKFVVPYRLSASAARTTRRTPLRSAKRCNGPRCASCR